ncbi:hypothetical protein GR183_08860 [Stappia sp. GBMRC 2046]|uniref:Transmembrane protein n=2 Tax=Stappia sediminis TaxID=2692190 RepID=A0A7X3LTW8_9HYPH|nr:hypothetical protein [Stappia sediminis]
MHIIKPGLCIVAMLAINALLYSVSTDADWDPSETGPFETAQALVLLLTAGLWTTAWRLANKGTFGRLLGIVLAGFAVWFGGREIAWGGIYGVPFAITRGLEIVIVAVILVMLFCQARIWFARIPDRTRTLLVFARTWRFFFLALGAASVLVGDFLDKKILALQYSQHLEEIFELSGWLCFLVAAACHVSITAGLGALHVRDRRANGAMKAAGFSPSREASPSEAGR